MLFSRIFNTKVVVTYADRRKEDTVIGAELEKTIHLFKYQDHFDLYERTRSNPWTSFGESQNLQDVKIHKKRNVTLQIMKSPR